MPILDFAENLPLEPQDPRLGRLIHFDPRSADYPVRMLLADTLVPRSYVWNCAPYLNQGQIGQCVGFACAHEIAADPVPLSADYALGNKLYNWAQLNDFWSDTPPQEGTSVLAGMQALVNYGFISEFRWAGVGPTPVLDDLILAVGYHGPAVLGIPWYNSMFNPDINGLIIVSGSQAGGHAILCVGVDIDNRLFRLHNSWGANWGKNGDCFISFTDLDRLLHEWGEAAIPVIRIDPNPQPVPPAPDPEPTPPAPEPVYNFFSIRGSGVFHDIHRVRGVVERRFVTIQEAVAAGKVACKTCKPR